MKGSGSGGCVWVEGLHMFVLNKSDWLGKGQSNDGGLGGRKS